MPCKPIVLFFPDNDKSNICELSRNVSDDLSYVQELLSVYALSLSLS